MFGSSTLAAPIAFVGSSLGRDDVFSLSLFEKKIGNPSGFPFFIHALSMPQVPCEKQSNMVDAHNHLSYVVQAGIFLEFV